MKIKTLEVKNWRSIKELKITAQDLMIIIGQNNHGKSNLLSAILFFFGEIKPQDLDFSQGSSELFVEIEFENLDIQDLSTFSKYVTNNQTIKVRKTAYSGGSFDYHGWIEICEQDFLQESNAGNYTNRATAQNLPFYPYLPASGRLTKQHIIDAQQAYIQNNPDQIHWKYELETANFMGQNRLQKEFLAKFTFYLQLKMQVMTFLQKKQVFLANY